MSRGPKPFPRPLPLTDHQRRVWELVAAGKEGKEIARETGMAYGTVKVHMSRLFPRIGCRNRVEAALKWHGLRP